MYEFTSRVRYSECDATGKLKPGALVNYLQDCSTFQSEDAGLTIEYFRDKKQAWVLNYWQIDIEKMPCLGDSIVIGTIPYELRGFLGFRNFYIKDKATGKMLVKANSVWTLIDIEKVKPVRAGEDMVHAFSIGEKLDMEYTDRKIAVEGLGNTMEAIVVGRDMLDTNNHVNNEQYIRLALTYIPDNCRVKRLRTEYKKSVYLGETMVPIVHEEAGKTTVEFTKDGESCVKCQFIFGE